MFSCDFRGCTVCVTYDGSLDDEVIWIANVMLDGQARSIDGTIAARSRHVQADVSGAVIRGLEWVCGASRA